MVADSSTIGDGGEGDEMDMIAKSVSEMSGLRITLTRADARWWNKTISVLSI